MRSNKALSGNPGSTRTSETRIVKRFIPLILLSVFLLTAISCRPLLREVFKTPKARVTSVRLSSNPFLTKEPLDIILQLEVINPNSYALSVSRAAYSLTVGKQQLVSGEKNEQIRLEPSQETTVTVPITMNPELFTAALREVIENRAVPYEFNGSLDIDAPLVGAVKAPFSKTGVLDPIDLLLKKKIPFN